MYHHQEEFEANRVGVNADPLLWRVFGGQFGILNADD